MPTGVPAFPDQCLDQS